ncbi:N-acetylmuramoyl-L-alanine amidase [Longimicrobium sp.]|uniref:N-acetylmuramoyl-L-alanine amidase n=1 Tax=Longimicrobium sp. TaxID=2029185 RepID=UPI002C269993|nr:N-acetylmuramoyl-L-alanine amidase [Longimicrobium sp.]HSU16281.1 N-acetylmuramoyl-L-alanine amidase [Longimicrobium sp.]
MNYKNIPAHEADFRAKGVDSDGKKFSLTPAKVTIPGTVETLDVVTCKPANGDESFFYKEEKPKQRIVVHFTAGYLKGDLAALTRPGNHVSTPFVIARDGTIYQLFSSKYWSYHLGPKAQGGNKEMSSSGVGIELSNVGYLTPKGDTLLDPYGAPYCNVADRDAYVTLPQPFRKRTRYAAFAEAQYASLTRLLRYLTATYKVPAAFLPEAKRYDVYADVAKFRGITTHVNYQPESYGKWDIGPAFDWARVIAALGTVPVANVATPAGTGG